MNEKWSKGFFFTYNREIKIRLAYEDWGVTVIVYSYNCIVQQLHDWIPKTIISKGQEMSTISKFPIEQFFDSELSKFPPKFQQLLQQREQQH